MYHVIVKQLKGTVDSVLVIYNSLCTFQRCLISTLYLRRHTDTGII